jgi:hypothetical protein
MAFAEFPLLYSSSQGSPVFIASILRLFSLGDEFKGTIEHWKGKEGEDVRRSMFQREIKALSYSTARTLFAMQLMAETNFDELKEMLEVDRQGLRTDLGRLRQFHLFVGSDDPATGESLTAPEPIRLMFEITEEVLNADDAKDIKRRAAQKSGHSPHVDPIKTEMRRITQLLNGKKLDDAEVVARSAIKKFPKNGDVCWQLGKIFLHKHPAALEDADKAFNEARQKKCARPELLHYSVYTKFKLNDEEGILRLTSHRIDPPPRGVPNVYRLIVYYRRGRNAEERGDKAEAISEYSTVSKEGARITADGRCDAAFMIVTKLMRASSIYAVNNSVSLYGLGRGSLPTAQLCSEFLALGIWSNYTASVFIKSFVAWWDAVESGFSNDESAVNVAKKLVANTNRSVGKLGFIDDEFDTTGRQVSQLLAHNERMARRIQDYARVRKLS